MVFVIQLWQANLKQSSYTQTIVGNQNELASSMRPLKAKTNTNAQEFDLHDEEFASYWFLIVIGMDSKEKRVRLCAVSCCSFLWSPWKAWRRGM